MIILFGISVSLLIVIAFYWIFSANSRSLEKQKAQLSARTAHEKAFTISSKDIETIAGFDVMTTQLDLARAYIETGRKNLAKNILNNVVLHGNAEQQVEAKRLLENMKL